MGDAGSEPTTALISGGTRGIGYATAAALLAAGMRVIVLGRTPEAATAAVASLTADQAIASGQLHAESADVADPTAVAALAERLTAAGLGGIDVLVNSAGVMSDRSAKTLRTDPQHWREILGVNLDGPFHLIAAVVPGMVERRRGRVISLSACLGRFTGPGTNGGLAPYRVSKAALNALTKNLAAETGNGTRGVLVDAVCPGHCRTDMGGADAPRSAAEGAATVVWLATREPGSREHPVVTGRLWEDGVPLEW